VTLLGIKVDVKTSVTGLSEGRNCVILRSLVLTHYLTSTDIAERDNRPIRTSICIKTLIRSAF